MKLIKLWLLWSMVSTTGLAVTPTTQQINEQPRPIEAEVIEESATDNETNESDKSNEPNKHDDTSKPKAKQKPANEETPSEESTTEESTTEEPYEIDDKEIGECSHEFSRSLATGGEEGDVWQYVCDDCGYTYFEPYETEVTE